MNLYQAVMEYERAKNQQGLTGKEIAEKARQIFDFDRLNAAVVRALQEEKKFVFDEKSC